MTQRALLAALLALLFAACTKSGGLTLGGLASSGMVLQHDAEVAFRGEAWPGSSVGLSTDWGETLWTTADDKGHWLITFHTPRADCWPHAINIEAGTDVVRLRDIYIGEVWLSLGQFDMQLPVTGWGLDQVAGSSEELARPTDSLLRCFVELPAVDYVPHDAAQGHWAVVDNDRMHALGAVPLAFARMLRDSLRVPVAIVSAALNETPMRAWTSPERQPTDSLAMQLAQQCDHDKAICQAYRAHLDSLPSLPTRSPDGHDLLPDLSIADAQVTLAGCDFATWPTMAVPGYWTGALADFDGVLWFHRTISIPRSWVGRDLTLHLGIIDDRDRTYVNNFDVGGFTDRGNYDVQRHYRVPAEVVKDSLLELAVRVTDEYGGGGLAGLPDEELPMRVCLADRDCDSYVGIEGEWHYWVAAQFDGNRMVLLPMKPRPDGGPTFQVVPLNQSLPAMLYNGMLCPLRGLAFRGCITNFGRGDYRHPGDLSAVPDALPRYVATLRDLFGERLPVLVAEPFSDARADDTHLGELRVAVAEARRHIHAVKMVGTLDLVEHGRGRPSGHLIVGRRLAALALGYVYDRQHSSYQGPSLWATACRADVVRLLFTNGSNLRLAQGQATGVELAGPDGVWHPAKLVRLDPPALEVFSYLVSDPRRVRYGAGNQANDCIVGDFGLPATAFDRNINEYIEEYQ